MTAEQAIARVREVHTKAAAPTTSGRPGYYCAHCSALLREYVNWPCETIRAIDGERPDQRNLQLARRIVNHVLEEAGTDVKTRQRINDTCDTYVRDAIDMREREIVAEHHA